jgi:hypothetical protein
MIVKSIGWVAFGAAILTAQLASGQTPAQTAAAKQSRYQIGQMERVLEGAVEHAVANIRDRLQAVGPTELLISDNARVRGFRLDGYGIFFDVVVPSFDTTVLWSIRTLDQNDLGLESALKALQTHVRRAGDVNLEQALRRIELQMDPGLLARVAAPAPAVPAGSRNASVSTATVDASAVDTSVPKPSPDPIFAKPDEAYRTEVTVALMDALLDHSGSLGVDPAEWLTIAARRNDERPRLAPADSDAQTFLLRLRGADLTAFLARQISREDALKRIEVRVF